MIKTNIGGIINIVFKYGPGYRKNLKQLCVSQFYSEEELEAYKNEKLKAIIRHSYNNVQYYNELFNKLKLKPEDICTANDLHKLPVITKQDIIDNYDKFISKNCIKFLTSTGYTSGTTGTPSKFLRDLYSINFESAALWRHWLSSGYKLGNRRITIRGTIIKNATDKNPPFWKYNIIENELLMSSFHISDKTIPYYIEKIIDFQPEIIYAYPSSIYLIAHYMVNNNIKYKLKGVFTSSETVLDYQRVIIEKAFDCKLFDWYGTCERVAAICSCEYGTYHEVSDYSIVEYKKIYNNDYEIIGTSLYNYAMPLLRYNTKDIVTICDGAKCCCGRNFKVIDSIQGRFDDYIKLKDGRLVGRLSRVFFNVTGLKEAQIIQDSIEHIIIKLVPSNKDLIDEGVLLNRIRERLGNDIGIEFKYVDRIDRTKSGKFRTVISNL